MSPRPRAWAVILAGGDGTRLAALTSRDGKPVPKQYCALSGPRTLLRMALDRAEKLVPASRTVTVVAAAHQQWWQRELEGSQVTVLSQPENRGTAAGILLPLLHVLARDPNAVLAIFPSDHYVAREWTLLMAVARAAAIADAERELTILLGVRLDAPDPGYGWVLPGPARHGVSSVRAFVEKPGNAATEDLLRAGALVNTFVVVSSGRALLSLFAATLPDLLASFRRVPVPDLLDDRRLAPVYRATPSSDFSREVLERVPGRLALLPVSPCGWTDLGTPERVAACLRTAAPQVGTAPLGDRRPLLGKALREPGDPGGRAPLRPLRR